MVAKIEAIAADSAHQGRTALGSAMMRDTPLTEVGRAKAGTHSTRPGGPKHDVACPFSGKLRPRCDASLSADRQTTHLAGVAPSGPKPGKPRFCAKPVE